MTDLLAQITKAKRYAILFFTLFLMVMIISSFTVYVQRKRANEAIALAAVKEALREAAVKQAQEREREAALHKKKAETLEQQANVHLSDAAKDKKTIAQQKAIIAALYGQQPPGTEGTPIENAQAAMIVSLEQQVSHLELATADLQGALTSAFSSLSEQTSATEKYKEGLKHETERAELLQRALKNLPKYRPNSGGLIAGKSYDGTDEYGAYYDRDFGIIETGIIATQHFVGVKAGLRW